MSSSSTSTGAVVLTPPPTVATQMRSPSAVPSAASTAASVSAAFLASPTMYCTTAPSASSPRMRSLAFWSVVSVRPMIVTAAPSRASSSAHALPMPPPPPVTSAAMPVSAAPTVPPLAQYGGTLRCAAVVGARVDGLEGRAEEIIAVELQTLGDRTRASAAAREAAADVMPMGVPANGQLFGPSPLFARRARGSHLEDLDGNDYVDFNMGYGALFVGHGHPAVMGAVRRQLDDGTLFVLACEDNTVVATSLGERFGQPLWRFTNSGTETTMAAVRTARAFTGRSRVVKV